MSHGFTSKSIFALFALTGLPQASAQSQTNPVPLINLPLSPSAVTPGGPSFTLTVNGTGFAQSSIVNWNGTPRATTFVSSSQLGAAILAGDISGSATASVTVVNSGAAGTGETSNVAYLPIGTPSISVSVILHQNLGGGPGGQIVADFNGDGKPDLAYTFTVFSQGVAEGWVGITLGNGDGTFQPQVSFRTSQSANSSAEPTGLVAADLNGDGKLDLAVVNTYAPLYPPTPTIGVLLGNGDGTFQPSTEFAAGATISPQIVPTIIAADFNGDGKPDLAVVNSDSTISLLLGNGDGSFQPLTALPTANGEYMVAGDFNGDGKLDLVVLGSVIEVYLGNGDGTFQLLPTTLPIEKGPTALYAADFNGDGKLDLVVVNYCGTDANCLSPGTISVLLGNGDGTFQGAVDYTTGYHANTAAIGDVNNDGKLDIVVSSVCGISPPGECLFVALDTLSIFLGNGDGTFQPQFVPILGQVPPSNHYLIAADVNGDGRLDFVGDQSIYLQTTLNLSTPSLAFGSQNLGSPTPPKPATLTNVATKEGTINISNTQITGPNAGDFSLTSTCPPGLPPTQQCQINTVFNPTAAGARSATVTITDSAVGSPHTIAVSGTGVAAPAVTLSSTSLTFTGQTAGTTSPPQALRLTNSGSATLTISSIATTGDFTEWNNCGASLAPGASCKIMVAFAPKLGGVLTGSVSIASNAAGSPQTAGLTGTGVVLALAPASIDFGNQAKGTTSNPQVVTLTNVTSARAFVGTVQIAGPNGREFTETNTCGASLAPRASCQVSVRFAPQFRGAQTATLQVFGGGTTLSATLAGTGK